MTKLWLHCIYFRYKAVALGPITTIIITSGQSNLTERPHRRRTWTVHWYSPGSASVQPACLSVCHRSEPCKTAESIKMLFRLSTVVGPRNHALDGSSDSPMRRGNFKGGKRRPVVKYSDYLKWAEQKRLNRSRCRLGFGLGWSQGTTY